MGRFLRSVGVASSQSGSRRGLAGGLVRGLAFAFGAAAAAGCGGGGTLEDAPPPPPEVGTLTVAWTIESNGLDVTCGDVNGGWVRLDVLAQGQGAGIVETLPCGAASATLELDAATFDVVAVLITPSNSELNTVNIPDVVVAGGQDTPRDVVFIVP